jgi:anoctamin-10
MHHFKKNEPERVMYNGQYKLCPITNKIKVFDPFTSFKRRLLMDLPIIIIGVAAVLGNFYLSLQLTMQVGDNKIL